MKKVKKHNKEYDIKNNGSEEKALEAVLNCKDGWEYRQMKALEIIAEELCILNKPLVEVKILPKKGEK